MRKHLFTLALFSCITLPSIAQRYTTAAGVRLGGAPGLTIQQSLGGKRTVEGIVQYGLASRQTTVTALLQRHQPLLGRGTNFYIGAGPHWGSYPLRGMEKPDGPDRRQVFGASFVGGLEMRSRQAVFSVDYKPALNIVGGRQILDGQFGLSLRYVLIDAKKPQRKALIRLPGAGEKRQPARRR